MGEKTSQILIQLWCHISVRHRLQLGFLLVIMLLTSIAEVVSIGAVFPYLGALMAPERIFNQPKIQPILLFLEIQNPQQIVLLLTIVFGVAVIFAGAMRLILLRANTRLSFSVGAELSLNIYRRTLYQPYQIHVSRNSSQIIDGVMSKTSAVIHALMMILTFISSTMIMLFIMTGLIFAQPLVALISGMFFVSVYILIIALTRKRLLQNSETMASASVDTIKSLQEGLGGIREVLIDGSQEIYCNLYKKSDEKWRQAQGENLVISASPRYILEAVGMLFIAILAYQLSQDGSGLAEAIPLLGLLALGAQRLLPVIQQVYSSWVEIQGTRASIQGALELLDQPMPINTNNPPIKFSQNITLKEVSFSYHPADLFSLKKINLNILKGERIGFIGSTGSGKSTLVDIIMGLLRPSKGNIEIDGHILNFQEIQRWRSNIAHVPQSIFLADSSVEENIAFGVPLENIDIQRVRYAAEQAKIALTIEEWPDKYKTKVGERGVRLSGGQKQRIGIARALYKRAEVIVFDEATSALDDATEREVMQTIDDLTESLTLIIIAHRLATLKCCSRIINIENGKISQTGTYSEIIGKT